MTSVGVEDVVVTEGSATSVGVDPNILTAKELRLYNAPRTKYISITGAPTTGRSINFPDADGTIALTSALGAYVDLTSPQTITGAKQFSTPPTFNTLPSRNSAQATVVGIQNFTFGLVTMNDILGRNTTDTVTNKTINTGANTIQISTASNANINTLLDQAVTSTSAPGFASVTLPAPGGTPTAIDYSEAGTFNGTASGAAAGALVFTFARYGRMVMVSWPQLNVAFVGPAKIQFLAAIPARLAPHQLEFDTSAPIDNGGVLASPGRVSVNPVSLDILFSANTTGANYTGPGNVGFLAGTIKYLTA